MIMVISRLLTLDNNNYTKESRLQLDEALILFCITIQ